MKKKWITGLLAAVLATSLLAGCTNQSTSSGSSADTTEASAASASSASSAAAEEAVSDAVEASSDSAEAASVSESADTAADAAEAEVQDFGKVDIPALDGSLCGAPIYIAYEKGFFAEHGIDANLTAADFETRKIGLNNGTIPLVNGDFQFFASAEQGINMKVVAGMHKGCIKLVVRADSDIQTPEDVKGLKIGVDEIGGTTFQVASVWLEEGGVSALQEDGAVSFLPFSDGNLELQALYSGDIDVAAVWDPLGDIAVSSGDAKVLLDIATDEPFAGKYCCFYYASEKALEENPALVRALLDSVEEAQEWIRENQEEALDLIVEGGYSQVEDEALAVGLLDDYEYDCCDEKFGDVQADVEYFAEKLKEIGYLESDPAEFAKNLYQEL